MGIQFTPVLGVGEFAKNFPHVSGSYYSHQVATGRGTSALTQNVLRVGPFWVPSAGTYDRIGVEHTVLAGSSTFRLGVYADDGTGQPGALVLDAGTVDTSTVASFQAITISIALSAGLYWVGGVAQGGNPTMRAQAGMLQLFSYADPTSSPTITCYSRTSVTGALPNPFGSTATGSIGPAAVFLRRA